EGMKKTRTRTHNDRHSDDIVIHLRCGDILYGHESYHLMTLKYFIYVLDRIFEQTNSSVKQQNTYIISQTSGKGSHRKEDAESIGNCRQLVFAFQNKLSEHYANRSVQIRFELVNNDIINDFALMMYAPNLVCGTSTFCLHAALANPYGRVFLPDLGPWDFLTKHLNEIVKSAVLPPTHSIVRVEANNWFLRTNDISQRQWHKRGNFSQLIVYLLSH
ncbi:hypothetical protein RFI_40147, partial [Reticulomyxa filosa]